MKREELDKLIGKEVMILFKDTTVAAGPLGYTPEFSAKYHYRKVGYYTCGDYDFKASHVAKVWSAEGMKA